MKFYSCFGPTPDIITNSSPYNDYNGAYDPTAADFLEDIAYVSFDNRLPRGCPAGPYPQNPYIGPAIGLDERSINHATEQFRYNLCSQVRIADHEIPIYNVANGIERNFECILKGRGNLIDVNEYRGMVFAIVENRFQKVIEENVPLYLDEYTQAIRAPFELGLSNDGFGFAGLMCVGFCKQMYVALVDYNPVIHKLLGVFIMRTDSASADEYNKVVNDMRDELSEHFTGTVAKADVVTRVEQALGPQRRLEYVQDLDRIHSTSCKEVLKLVDIRRAPLSGTLQMWFSSLVTRTSQGCSWLTWEKLLECLPCDLKYRLLRYKRFPFRPIKDPPYVLRLLENGDIAVYIVRIRLDGRMYVRYRKFTLKSATDTNGRQYWIPKAYKKRGCEQHDQEEDDNDIDEENYDLDAPLEAS